MADEERDAEFLLELPDVPAERRLGDVQAGRGLSDARFRGNSDERAQVAEVHGAGFYTRSVLRTSKDVLDSRCQSAQVMPQWYGIRRRIARRESPKEGSCVVG